MSLTKLIIFAYDAFFIDILYSVFSDFYNFQVITIWFYITSFTLLRKEYKLFMEFHNSLHVNSKKKCMVIFLEWFQFIVTKPNSFAF